jgi:hypothetical protein
VGENELGALETSGGGTDNSRDGGLPLPMQSRPSTRRPGFPFLQRRSTTGTFSAARSSVT